MEEDLRRTFIEALQTAFAREQADQLSDSLRGYWTQQVPQLITAGPHPIRLKYDDAKITALLLEPVEAFIVGSNSVIGDHKFDHLKENDISTFLCNRSFRAGEPTYSCRDCAVDSTCVLCIECFKQSAHKNHRYKISSSTGGGYCDCGDPEAWKSDYACSKHQPPDGSVSQNVDLEDARKRLHKDVVKRFKAVVQCGLCYVYQMLTLRDGESLPDDLALHKPEGEDVEFEFVTILYNDETHTYDQVIGTLSRTLECSPEEALEYATIVDHEGRSPVKFGSYAECERVKTFVERNSRRPQPLRLDVILTSIYVHQVLALKVMNWIQKLADTCEGFKALICDVSLQVSPVTSDLPIVSALLLKDVRLWKCARSSCHALFMATFLSFGDAKIEFARLFARLYPQLMTAFISDDHDHSDSCTSLSVQIFTVPTVARTLFSDRLVEMIVKSFVLMCQTRRNDQGRLSFDRTTQPATSQQFKRGLYILYDARYLLNTIPSKDQWTESLRRGFTGAFEQFMLIMIMMEGMDGHTRRTQSHVEYETDWEPAFNVQLRMGPIIHQLQNWCASDEKVLISCTEKLLDHALKALGSVDKLEKKEVARYVYECVEYDVGTQIVSIHHPLVRLLAGLVVSALSRKITLQVFNSRQFIDECLKGYARELAEFPLRTLVLVAQANAGMWRRNGYALANQIFFYQQPRCREEMLDKDVVMLQVCAAVMQPDEFLINVLNKFGLILWADETFDATPLRAEDDSIRQVMFLAEEFLYCLMVFVGERYYPNIGVVTPDDCLRNEIIHQLCIQSTSYSELVKNLPEQDAKATALDDIVKEVANFKRPSSTSKGFFELKQEFTSRYNMFFYHYSRIDHSKAEDTQRKQKKKDGEEVVFPPPIPPEFTEVFRNVIHLLDCDVFIHLVNLTVRRALNHHPRSFSEGQLLRVLFLVGYALHEEKRAREQGQQDFKFVEKAVDAGIFSTLRELRTQKDGEAYRTLVEWVLQYYDCIVKTDDVVAMDTSEPVPAVVAVPTSQDGDDSEAEKRRRAAARRDRIMQQMKLAQSTFASQNVGELNEIALPSDDHISIATSPSPVTTEPIVALGAARTTQHADLDLEEKHTCILCSESHPINLGVDAFVAVGYVQRSTVLSQEDRNRFSRQFVEQPPTNMKDLCQRLLGNPLYMPVNLPCAPHVSSCGHLLHSKCWKTYFDSVVARERRRSIRLRTNTGSFDVTKNEFRCPLCSRLCNAAIPFFPPLIQKESMDTSGAVAMSPSLNNFVAALNMLLVNNQQSQLTPEQLGAVEINTDDFQQFAQSIRFNIRTNPNSELLSTVREAVSSTERLQGIDVKNTDLVSDAYVEAVRTFQNQVYQMALNTSASATEDQSITLSWNACSYSIQSIEMCLRFEKKSLLGSFSSRQFLCLKSLIRATCWSSSVYESKHLIENAVRIFCTVFNPSPNSQRHVFNLDVFTLLLTCTSSFPWLPWTEEAITAPHTDALSCRAPTGDVFDQHILSVIYALHVMQALLGIADGVCPPSSNADLIAEDLALRTTFSSLHKRAPGDISDGVVCPANLESRMREAVSPFLRSTAIFYYFVTGIKAPESLTGEIQTTDTEFIDLMIYLGLPLSFTQLLTANPALTDLVNRWIGQYVAAAPVKHVDFKFPRPFPLFASLPPDFTDVINRASQESGCRVEADERRSPAMCLVCGALLCSQSMCCQYKLDTNQPAVGACTFHAASCGAGTGIFLRVRENQILMLHGSNKGCFAASPYVDEYGEPDPFLRRGNPLHLSQERVEQLHRHHMHHDIADEVSHAMDQNSTLAGFDWYHF